MVYRKQQPYRVASIMAAEVENQRLDISDLAEVDGLLRKHGFFARRFEILGTYLGLSSNTIDGIKNECQEDLTRCLFECLKLWLSGADDVEPTYFALIKALEKMEEKNIAQKIDYEKHPACFILSQFKSNQPINEHLLEFTLFLAEEKIVKTILLPGKSDERRDALLVEIKRAVCFDYRNLEKFGCVLQKANVTAAAGNAIRMDYWKQFPNEHTEMTKKENPTLQLHSLNEFSSMRYNYASTVFKACKAMEAIDVGDLKMYLRHGFPHLTEKLSHDCDILVVITEECSLVNIDLLEAVAKEFKVEDALVLVQEYKKNMEEFCRKIPLKNGPLNIMFSAGFPLQSETLQISVRRNVKDCTLNDVRELVEYTCQKLSCHVNVVFIREGNSFSIMCSFPLCFSESLIATALENIGFLRKNDLDQLKIGFCTVYDHEKMKDFDDERIRRECESDKYTLNQLMLAQAISLLNRDLELTESKREALQQKQEKINTANEEIQLLKEELQELQIDHEEAHNRSEVIIEEKKELVEANEALSEQLEQKVSSLKEVLEEKQELEEQVLSLKAALEKKEELELIGPKVSVGEEQLGYEEDFTPLIFEDEVYGDIIIEHSLLIAIIKTRQFQRLRDIKQLGYAYRSVPKATHTRLQHSIGMCYLAGKYVKKLKKRHPEFRITDAEILCVQVAALCYNLGHGPFSHVFTMFLKDYAEQITHDSVEQDSFEKLKTSEVSAEMLEHMIKENNMMALFEAYGLDVNVIKDLMSGTPGKRAKTHKDKEFLYEIVVDKMSGLDVSVLDSTTRDAMVIGKKVNFKWRVFLNKVHIKRCTDNKLHICFEEDDLDTYNDLFNTRYGIFRELYYLRKNRVVATLIFQILLKSSKFPIIGKNEGKSLTIPEATKDMHAFTQLTDGILHLIRSSVTVKEVQELLDCLDTLRLLAQIGYIIPSDEYKHDLQKLTKEIIKASQTDDLTPEHLIIDPIMSGYENHLGGSKKKFFVSTNGTVDRWTKDWAKPLSDDVASAQLPWRIFLVSGDKELIQQVKGGLMKLINNEKELDGKPYPDSDNVDLMLESHPLRKGLRSYN